ATMRLLVFSVVWVTLRVAVYCNGANTARRRDIPGESRRERAQVGERLALELSLAFGAQDIRRDVVGRAQLPLLLHLPESFHVGEVFLGGRAHSALHAGI